MSTGESKFMSAGQAHLWNLELEMMRYNVRYALNNLEELRKRGEVQGALEVVLFRLSELCDLTKGEDK